MVMPNEIGSELVERDENGRVKAGSVLNPTGRPKGAISFATKWKRFIEKVAEDSGKTPEEIDHELYQVALEKAREGSYDFYRDIQDRVFGKPLQSMDHTTDGKELPTPIIQLNK